MEGTYWNTPDGDERPDAECTGQHPTEGLMCELRLDRCRVHPESGALMLVFHGPFEALELMARDIQGNADANITTYDYRVSDN